MNAAQGTLAILWIGLTLYALMAGADFGAGVWDLLAGNPRRGLPQRELIEEVIGPIWEANHVWLIFVVTLLWTTFPPVFASVMSTLYIPLTLAAIGIIGRGAAFAFRKAVMALWQQRLFGGVFALSSVLTPFFLGTVAGGIASGRVPLGLARGDVVTSWVNPTSFLGGILAIGTCAYLAAMYLCHDAVRLGRPELAEVFRHRAMITGAVVGVVVLAGIPVLYFDAPGLFHGLTHRALPVAIVSAVAGLASMGLLVVRRYVLVRVGAAVAVAAVMWGWAVAQYPYMLPPDAYYARVAAPSTVLDPVLIVIAAGAVILFPSLGYLIALFQRREPAARREDLPA
ncbi:cytochrome d ubiquinol oxidase subunit II [Planosporangium thailandense]|uniref:Cytochrome d ubiquinol oxidase subunit II n=1 Tax=Planosporangium thailandense TaxID=765197 RepID=A0ABX0XZF7_9ACTN|nr:cytochrome d ubiquinol oxidase subunit II [Planosporangium thailandense]NJC71178.1 cytochrome d ubiquinol oxidase subunit II [Planosporangium thailandense]